MRFVRCAALVAILMVTAGAGCSSGSDDDTDAANDGTAAAPAPSGGSASSLPEGACTADGTITGAVEASFDSAPAGTAGGGGADEPPAYYQASDEGVIVAFLAERDDVPPGIQVRSEDRTWTTNGGDGLTVQPDGSGAEAVELELSDGQDSITVDVTITCG